MVIITDRKDEFSRALARARKKRLCRSGQMPDCSILWVCRMQNHTVRLMSALSTAGKATDRRLRTFRLVRPNEAVDTWGLQSWKLSSAALEVMEAA